MKLKYVIALMIILCALILGYFVIMGPKQGLQLPPVEPKAMSYLDKHNLLTSDETLTAYKANGFYTYNEGTVITDKRIFIYQNDKSASIPLEKISMVVIRDTHLGHQEVLIAAQADGAIGIEVYHSSVPELIKLLHVSEGLIKNHTEQKVAEKI